MCGQGGGEMPIKIIELPGGGAGLVWPGDFWSKGASSVLELWLTWVSVVSCLR